MKPIADSVMIGRHKWLERIHFFQYIWLYIQNA